ncbi:MAG: ribosome maturation factor RimM [Gammaproteobacteria bacterium]|uniref:Ribosome maturation factor RimM n=1 Tax=Candidatus Thiopontia autotrophica TaxID=2841688 RepID=A0A8J6TVX2_9GAMM|nr:ribosome maturation factor RimM [Candidatus Thiopontia autotrophica]MBL6968766.1 ribosome maturation factor RimM [Gammaproteobacteria bacterium]
MNKKSTDSLVLLGRVSGLFGVRGWVKIYSYTSPRENILRYRKWLLTINGEQREFVVKQGKRHGKGVVVLLDGFNDRTAAEELIGVDISVRRDALEKLTDDEYYWSDLIGCQVINSDDGVLGEVSDLMETGANDVMVISGEDKDVLIPFVNQWVTEVDLEEKRITVEWRLDF